MSIEDRAAWRYGWPAGCIVAAFAFGWLLHAGVPAGVSALVARSHKRARAASCA